MSDIVMQDSVVFDGTGAEVNPIPPPDYNGVGTEAESTELQKLEALIHTNPDTFEHWSALVTKVQEVEGGITRNSSPQAITALRNVFDRLLLKYPLFFGYWKKYAEIEFAIGGTEASDMIYERGIASIPNSVDLWTAYCDFKMMTTHDQDVIRELFERGASCVGLDYQSTAFWDKYLEFEDRIGMGQNAVAVLRRLVKLPTQNLQRYFERLREAAQNCAVEELVEPKTLDQLRDAAEKEAGRPLSAVELDRELRTRIDAVYYQQATQASNELTKRWTFEQNIKPFYFHVNELDEAQLVNWHKYLDFEEGEGDQKRIAFLYERCLVATAYYEEFWLRYIRWMSSRQAQPFQDIEAEIRNVYNRAACLFVPIALPKIRYHWALFEEMSGRLSVAEDIYKAILHKLPGHVETIIALVNLKRRHDGIETALAVLKEQLQNNIGVEASAAITVEWARLLWKIAGQVQDARLCFSNRFQHYKDCRSFWLNWLNFEIEQPTDTSTEPANHERIKNVLLTATDVVSSPSILQEMRQRYMAYLLERGGNDIASEYLSLINQVDYSVDFKSCVSSLNGFMNPL